MFRSMKAAAAAALVTSALAGIALAGGAFLGVQVQDADGGVRIQVVRDASPAKDAGLAVGDVLQAIDDQAVATAEEVHLAIGKKSPGDSIALKVKRGDRVITANATLRARPEDPSGLPSLRVAPEPSKPAEPMEPAEPAKPARPSKPAKVAKPAPPAADRSEDDAMAPPRKGGFLGITLADSEDGTAIATIAKGGPADRAKLRAGDRIVELDGTEVASSDAISEYLSTKRPGSEVEVTVEREGKRRLRTVTLGAYGEIAFADEAMPPAEVETRPESPPQKADKAGKAEKAPKAGKAKAKPKMDDPVAKAPEGAKRPWLGVFLAVEEDGVVIEDTVEDGPARKAGIQAGDKIVALGDRELASAEELMAALRERSPGQDIELRIERDGESRTIGLELGTMPEEFAAQAPPPAMDPDSAAKARKDAEVAAAEHARRSAQADAAKRRSKAATGARSSQSWDFPAGYEMTLRIEKDGEDFWITTGSGNQGIRVPADGETTLKLVPHGNMLEVEVVPSEDGVRIVAGARAPSRNAPVLAADEKGGMMTLLVNPEAPKPAEHSVQRGEVRVVPRQDGGEIVIHNHGGIVIVGDAHGGLVDRLDVLTDARASVADRLKKLESLGYRTKDKAKISDKKTEKGSD